MRDPDQVDRIYCEALGKCGAERAAFLDATCPDAALRQEVESMLRDGDAAQAAGFLKTTLLGGGVQAPVPPKGSREPGGERTTVGPYRVLRRLGRGGMGVVYEAEHGGTGRRVALKTVRGVASGELASIRREIHALARIDHPGIVRILDEGLADGVPYYAMELVPGAPLRSLQWDETSSPKPQDDSRSPTMALPQRALAAEIREIAASAPTRARSLDPVRLHRILTIVRRLCAPLAYMHGEGLVHRDLKPENVMVRSDGMPVIVDFGLSTHFGGPLSREKLQTKGYVVGTVSYMSPEQGRGDIVDARGDLYSVGCILYELCAGRPPFVGSSPFDVLAMHWHQEPERPSTLVDGVPETLETLILKLLSKEPCDRVGHADDVAAQLAALGAEDGLSIAGPRPRAYLYRPSFVGRGAVTATLTEHLRHLSAGRGGLVLIGGESGAGKTRLMVELAGLAADRGIRAITGECAPPTGAEEAARVLTQGMQAPRRLLQAIADACRERGQDYTDTVLGERGKVLARYEPALEILPGQQSYPDAADLPLSDAKLRLWSYLAETLSAFASAPDARGRDAGALLLMLDDLQWADDLTLGFLSFLVRGRHLDAMRVLIVGTFRSEEGLPLPTDVTGAPSVRTISLGRLEEGAVGAMVADMLAMAAPPAVFARYLSRHSEGNPFFIAEYMLTAVQEGILFRDATGVWHAVEESDRHPTEADYEGLPLPSTLRELVSRRLHGLSKEASELCGAACVLGREVEGTLLRAVAGLPDNEFMEAVGSLVTRQVVIEQRADLFRFAHDKLREIAYERLEPARRVALHRASAEAIESLRAARLDEHLADLGRHWDRAGEAERARRYYLPAARRAAGSYAHEDASRLYRAFLALGSAPSAEDIEARIELGEKVLLPTGRTAESLDVHRKALMDARALGLRRAEAASMRSLLHALRHAERLAEARAMGEDALAILRDLGDRAEEGNLLADIASVDVDAGRTVEARARCEAALAALREAGDRRSEASTLVNLAIMHHREGTTSEARTLFEDALARTREAGDVPQEVKVTCHLASLQYYLGDLPNALALFRQALEGAKRLGDIRLEGLVRGNMAGALDAQGAVQEAAAEYREAARIQKRIGDRRMLAGTLNSLGTLLQQQGNLDDARTQYEQALTIARELCDRRIEGQLLANIGNVAQDEGRRPEARAHYSQSLEILRAVGDRWSESYAMGYLATLALEEGDVTEARALLSAALEIRREVGDRTLEGAALRELARIERLVGSLGEAEKLLAQAAPLLAESGEQLEMARWQVERAHLTLAMGGAAAAHADSARAIARHIGAGEKSPLRVIIRRLERAIDASREGQPVARGEAVDDLPPALQSLLA